MKIAIMLAVAGLFLLLNKLYFHLDAKDIEKWVKGFGVWAPIILLAIFTLRPFTLIPLSIVAMSSGLIFGPYMGTLYAISGTVLGAIASFLAVRLFIGEMKIQDEEKENIKELKNDLEEHGFKSVLMLRLIPLLNFDLITFICAKTRVVWWKYTIATLVGTIPGSFMFGYFGSSILKFKPINLFILAGIILVMLTLGYLMKRNLSHKYDLDELKSEMQALKKA